MEGPLESLYFNWLCAKVMMIRSNIPSNNHWGLLKILHNTEFVWLLSGDDNRAVDGQELRSHFILEADIPDDPVWRSYGCSLLEMFIAFSKRAEFMTDVSYRDWFWEFMDNLNLRDYHDGMELPEDEIEEILDHLIWRTYDRKGNGSIFPIRKPKHDQRKIEIWYQFCDYLLDQDRLP